MKHSFGTRIKELRESNEMSQADLATVFKVTRQTISAWEKNLQETGFDMLFDIARFFEVSIDYLLGFID